MLEWTKHYDTAKNYADVTESLRTNASTRVAILKGARTLTARLGARLRDRLVEAFTHERQAKEAYDAVVNAAKMRDDAFLREDAVYERRTNALKDQHQRCADAQRDMGIAAMQVAEYARLLLLASARRNPAEVRAAFVPAPCGATAIDDALFASRVEEERACAQLAFAEAQIQLLHLVPWASGPLRARYLAQRVAAKAQCEAAYTRAQDAAYDATAFSMAADDDLTERRKSQFASAVLAKQPDGEPLVVTYNTAVVRAVRAIDRERKEEKTKREHEAAVKAQKYAQEAADLREIQTSLSPRAALEAIARRIAAIRDEGFPNTLEGIENLRKLRLYKAVAKARLKRRANEALFQEGVEKRRLEELEEERRERERLARQAAVRAERRRREAAELEAARAEAVRKAGMAGKLKTFGKGVLAKMLTRGKLLRPIDEARAPAAKDDDDTASTGTFEVSGLHGEDHDRVVRKGAVAHRGSNRFGTHFSKKLHVDAIQIRRTASNNDREQDYWRRSLGGHTLPKHAMAHKKANFKMVNAFHQNRAERYRPSMALAPFQSS